VNDESDITRLEEQLDETRARRLMAERDVSAVARHTGLSRTPKKLDRDRERTDAQLEKWRAREADLEQKIELLRNPPPVEVDTITDESLEDAPEAINADSKSPR